EPAAMPRGPTEAPPQPPPPERDDGPLAPLPAELQQRIDGIRPDPPPPHLVRDTHYWISNEQSHFLWHEAVRDRGGAFVGVGTDQNYLLAGWARPVLLVLMDFDGGVVDLHRAYGVMFRRAESPDDFVSMWSPARQAEVEGWIAEALPAEHAAGAIEALRDARPRVEDRLRAVDQQYRALGIPTFLSDPAQFEHLRTLWRNGRVVAVRGDLTAELTMLDLAEALRAAGLELGVLYLSNAEQYFRYGRAFRRNVTALPMAADGVVLRTHGWIQFRYVQDEEYHYNRQPAPLFSEWMARGRAWGVPAMLEHRTKTDVRGSSVLDRPPPRGGRSQPAP
ncbi:MAG: hypothetical protein KDK70_22505, partial [Myxococcales bacterium]|nr:hypothetical protein [Myxococcales bacterium]